MKKQNVLCSLTLLAIVTTPAFAAGEGPDFSSITGAVSATTVVAAIAAVAAIKILPGVARWGFGQVQKLFR